MFLIHNWEKDKVVNLPKDSKMKWTQKIVHLESAFKNLSSDELYCIMCVHQISTGLIRTITNLKQVIFLA